jgi:hypothetical protein
MNQTAVPSLTSLAQQPSNQSRPALMSQEGKSPLGSRSTIDNAAYW